MTAGMFNTNTSPISGSLSASLPDSVSATVTRRDVVTLTDATVALTEASHAGKFIALSRAAGQALTLPAATGSGVQFEFFVLTTITSNSTTIKVANSTDVLRGHAVQPADAGSTMNGWEASSTDDTITFNGSTTGGIAGDIVRLVDIAAGYWFVQLIGSATGTEATPFSATV